MNASRFFLLVVTGTSLLACASDVPAVPSAAQTHYLATDVMGIVHYGLNTYVDREWGFGDTPPSVLDPKSLDPEQWVVAAKRGGLGRLVLVAKHHDGFCLFPSKYNADYSIANTPWQGGKGDVVRSFSDACRRHGVEFGVYLSPWDRHQGNYGTPAYADYFQNQWDELLSGYGPVWEIWLDGANGGDGWYGGAMGKRKLPCAAAAYYRFDELIDKLARHHALAVAFNGGKNPNCVTWSRTENGMNAETCWLDRTGAFLPVEADTPMRKSGWFWHPLDRPKSLAELVEVYFLTVGRNSVLNLGLAPNRDGVIGDDDARRLQEFGDYVRAFEATDLAAGARREETSDGRTLTCTLTLPAPRTFSAVDIGEDLMDGQKVESWTLVCETGGVWRTVASGTTVGHRRIERFGELSAMRVRLTASGRRAVPSLKTLALRLAPPVPEEPCDAFEQWRSPCKVSEVRPGVLEFDFLRKVFVDAFKYSPPKDRTAEVPDKCRIDISDDGQDWRHVIDVEFGNLRANPVSQIRMIPGGVEMRYVRMTATGALEGAPTWRGTEIEFFKDRKVR